jgi:hypothetical protein
MLPGYSLQLLNPPIGRIVLHGFEKFLGRVHI